MMSMISLGPLNTLAYSRYTVQLSNSKRVVLFRLPSIGPVPAKDLPPNASPDGWIYYAMEAECPHAGGPLATAPMDIEDSSYIVTCPWHGYDFNVETGESNFGIKACTFAVDVRTVPNVVSLVLPDKGVLLENIEPISENVKQQKSKEMQPRLPSPSLSETIATSPSSLRFPNLNDNATVCDWCAHVLNTPNPERKIELTLRLFSIFSSAEPSSSPMSLGRGTVVPPAEPPRDTMQTIRPWQMPKPGNAGTLKSRITILHALANIEQWAIDLALDICVRFSTFRTQNLSHELPRAFFHDWLKVAADEAKHFSLLRARLEELGSHFGALPVHHGLWESAMATAHDLRARISIIALVHEARGLDINPMTIEKFRRAGDSASVDALMIIHHDEITHVTTGHRWLSWICQQEQTDPVQVFRSNVQKYFKGRVKGPFNAAAREQAGMDGRYYEDLVGDGLNAGISGG
jgi:uncharacterized ferritin-like protein (DUF455 family)